MNFLKAGSVRLKKTYSNSVEEMAICTSNYYEQQLYVDMGANDSPDKVEVNVLFDANHKAPEKVSLSANQYTMNPFEIKVSLYKKYAKQPYKTLILGELRSIFDLEEGTKKIVLEFVNMDNAHRFADVKLIANYVKF